MAIALGWPQALTAYSGEDLFSASTMSAKTPHCSALSYVVVPPDAAIAWPDAFGSRFTVFVDTEEEFDCLQPLRRENRATETMRAPSEMHALFAAHGVPASFLHG